jgi:inorganic pyrophosphatase
MCERAVKLGTLPTLDGKIAGAITVVIETSKGSRNKLAYDVESGAFRLKHILPAGSSFPYDFGFVPGTEGADGDPLDVLVFLDEPVPTGTVVPVRLIGVLEARQQEPGKAEIENHRFLAVPCAAQDTAHIHTLDDLRPGLVDELEAFFTDYNRQRSITFRVTGRGGPDRALALIKAGCNPR